MKIFFDIKLLFILFNNNFSSLIEEIRLEKMV